MAGAGEGEEVGDIEVGEDLEEELGGQGLEGHRLRGLCFAFGVCLVGGVGFWLWIRSIGWDVNDEEIVLL